MAARLASGRNVKPMLTKSINGQNVHDDKEFEDLKVDKANLKLSEKHFSRLVMIGGVQPMDHASLMMRIEWQVKLAPARSGI